MREAQSVGSADVWHTVNEEGMVCRFCRWVVRWRTLSMREAWSLGSADVGSEVAHPVAGLFISLCMHGNGFLCHSVSSCERERNEAPER